MSKPNPLLIVSSIHPSPQYKTIQPNISIYESNITKRNKQSKKFIIKALHNQIKVRTMNLQQKQQDKPQLHMTSRIFRNVKPSIPIQRPFQNSLELFIGHACKQFRETRSVSRQKTSFKKHSCHLKKQQNIAQFIRKSLLQPCQITSATICQRSPNSFHNKTNVRQYGNKNRFSNFSIRKKYKNNFKLIPEKLQPWLSENIQLDQQNF